MGSLDFVRKHVLELPSYEPILPYDVLSEELGIGTDQLVKLDANENPFGPVPEVSQALSRMNTLHIYPDPESRRIRRLLADYHLVPESSLVIGAGADELIDSLMRIVLEPGDYLLNCPPTFGMYAFDGSMNKARILEAPRNADFSLNLPAIEELVTAKRPKILFLANPNNPDGGMISQQDFSRLIELPILLVLDEAYINFGGEDRSKIDVVNEHENLIVLRSFSKWAGLAGLRIGYGVFPSDWVPLLMKSKQPYNVSVAAEQAAVATMQNLDRLKEYCERIIQNREHLISRLGDISWLESYPSEANFILCRVKQRSAAGLKEILRKQGILIRHFDKPGLSDHIRISVGRMDQIDTLMTALKRIR
jgi:histidinol-phosphate aminotransferase